MNNMTNNMLPFPFQFPQPLSSGFTNNGYNPMVGYNYYNGLQSTGMNYGVLGNNMPMIGETNNDKKLIFPNNNNRLWSDHRCSIVAIDWVFDLAIIRW